MFIVIGLDADFNLNRLERYILLAEQSKILPILLLNKCDVVDDVTEYMLLTSQRFPTVTNHVISAVTGYNMEILYKYLPKGTTVVLLGSSGAGKSTITNWLLNHKQQEVRNVREDDSHGRHTTTSRQLFLLPCGAYLIDTPGIRELGLLGEVEGDTFLDIELIANKCQFTKCDHVKTKGCAVVEAVTSGIISQKQIDNFLKLKREKAFIDSKTDQKLSWKKKQESRKTQKKRKKILTQRYGEKGLL
jgi:ribosome biogenesis GTPase